MLSVMTAQLAAEFAAHRRPRRHLAPTAATCDWSWFTKCSGNNPARRCATRPATKKARRKALHLPVCRRRHNTPDAACRRTSRHGHPGALRVERQGEHQSHGSSPAYRKSVGSAHPRLRTQCTTAPIGARPALSNVRKDPSHRAYRTCAAYLEEGCHQYLDAYLGQYHAHRPRADGAMTVHLRVSPYTRDRCGRCRAQDSYPRLAAWLHPLRPMHKATARTYIALHMGAEAVPKVSHNARKAAPMLT